MNTPSNYVGQHIRSLQTMLRTLAHADETLLKLVPDGIYGPNTVQAVREFQRQNGLPVTGDLDDVGGETRGPIEALCLLVGNLRHAAPPYKSKSTALCWNSRRLISRRYPVIAASWSLPM